MSDNAARATDLPVAFPCGDTGRPEEVGLALSGGGYRATLFHLGALRRLNELGWLGRLDRISGVSGGSFMAGMLAGHWNDLEWDPVTGQALNFDVEVWEPTLQFADRRIDAFVIVLGLIPFVNPATLLDWWLHYRLTRRMDLSQVPATPRFVFNAANLATGVSWRFSPQYMGDSRIVVVCSPKLRLSRAIAASAAFPPYVAPLILSLGGMTVEGIEGADLFDDRAAQQLKRRVVLLDGGAYDNLAVESVEGRCRIVLASDAGGNLGTDPRTWRYGFWWPLVRRTLDLAVEVGRRQRRRALLDRAAAGRALVGAGERNPFVTEHAAIWRTALQISGHPKLPSGWHVDPLWASYLSRLPTRMWPMERDDRDHLVNWGYLTTDIVLRTWVPELTTAGPPVALPFADASFSRPPGAGSAPPIVAVSTRPEGR